MLLLGAHFSTSGGLHDALFLAHRYQCNALQLFTKNAATWKERELNDEDIELFSKARIETGITDISSHASYLINLATPDKRKLTMSRNAVVHELTRCNRLNIPYTVLHPGSHMGKGEEIGCARAAETINEVFESTDFISPKLLLETTAGQGSNIGHTFTQLAKIMERVKHTERLGICFDTCHSFAAGYDIRIPAMYEKTFDEFNSLLGLKNLSLIHINDSKHELGSRRDRHEHIGQGMLGIPPFMAIINESVDLVCTSSKKSITISN
ncbi:MAG: deoxyribonuclease IV [Pseudomonadota bacterium]